MAHEKFTVEVLTPEGEVFNDEVEQVSTRTGVGSLGILARHQPLLGPARAHRAAPLQGDGGDVVRFAQGEGYVQVTPEGVLLLVEEAIEPDKLDVSDLENKLREAEDELSNAEENSEAARRAARAKKRWEAFLRVARGEDPAAR
jgi:F-type H+-transporting ATPase subunit epsilon